MVSRKIKKFWPKIFSNFFDIVVFESNSTSSRCVKYDPNEEIIKEPGLTTEALFGALFMFAGVCLAALWRDSINSAAVAARLDQFYQALRRFSYSILLGHGDFATRKFFN